MKLLDEIKNTRKDDMNIEQRDIGLVVGLKRLTVTLWACLSWTGIKKKECY